MFSARQQHCLTGIGITQWKLRQRAKAFPADVTAIADTSLTDLKQTAEPHSTESETKLPVVEFESFATDDWTQLEQAMQQCQNCALAKSCTRKVPGKGFKQADLMIIGEAPGHEEDLQGKPFVGRAGQLLDKILQAIHLDPDNVYITNILKCRPPNNRDPHADEITACSQFLDAQIRLVQPRVILSVGRISSQNLLNDPSPLGRLRTKSHFLPGTDLPLRVTYHPAYLLRNPAEKAKVWQDMKALHSQLNKLQNDADH